MCEKKEDVKLFLKAIINKDKNKVFFAEADSHFVDILLSFLTLPLGRIIKVLDKHYGDEAPAIGSLSSLYRSLASLDRSHFWEESAKKALLNPPSSFEDEYGRLKLDIAEFQPAESFFCPRCLYSFRSVSMYYDDLDGLCNSCSKGFMTKYKASKASFTSCDRVFVDDRASFIISDDLQIFPSVMGLCQIISILGITDMDEAKAIKVTIGMNEMLSLLKASFISPTPLSNLILKKASVILDSEPKTSVDQIEIQENPKSKSIVLKVMVQKSSGKFLYAQAEKDFVEFLFGLVYIPLGGVHHLLSGKACIKAIDNLYRSAADLIHDENFMSPDTKNRLMKPNVVHGCVSEDYILPLNQACLPASYVKFSGFRSTMFPQGRGRYLDRPTTYLVMDDLTVKPFCIFSIFSSLNAHKVSMSDVKEIEVQIGAKEGLSILKAALGSTTALTDGLVKHITKAPVASISARSDGPHNKTSTSAHTDALLNKKPKTSAMTTLLNQTDAVLNKQSKTSAQTDAQLNKEAKSDRLNKKRKLYF